LEILKNYAKARNATINDLILTAIFRAMFQISKPPYGVPMDIPITIDLRKYLPDHKAQAIRNFSSGMVIRMDRRPNESFEETLSRIQLLTKDIKNKHPSVENIRMAEIIESMNFPIICSYFKTMSRIIDFASQNLFFVFKKCSPVLSNFGFISKSLIKFGKNTVTDAYILPPVVRAPGILLVASTYNDIISLGVGYYKPSVQSADMQGLLDKIRDELINGCKQ
jgi:NRPS condensation-like uncharacterized protein